MRLSPSLLHLGLRHRRNPLLAVITVPILAIINSLLSGFLYERTLRQLAAQEIDAAAAYQHFQKILTVVTVIELLFFSALTFLIYRLGIQIVKRLQENFQAVNDKLRISEEKYRTILEQIDDGIVIFREEKILWVNDRFCQIVRAGREEVLGGDIYDFIAPEYRSIVRARYLLRQEGKPVPRSYEIDGLRRDGTRVAVEVIPTFIRFEGELASQTVIRDLTEANQIKSQLLQSSRMAAIGEMAGNLAHQLNNPLVGVIDMAKFLLDKEKLPPEYRPYLETILEAGQDAAKIIRNLLKFAGGRGFSVQQVDLRKLVDDVLSVSGRNLNNENIKVVKDFPAQLPLVECNEVQIGQVLLNIIQNARQAMSGGGTLTISIKELPGIEMVELRLKDTGCGIKAEHLPRIFDPCFTTKSEGTGLGLSVAYRIIKEHKGTIQAESKEGEGAAFLIRLPVKAGE